MSRIIIFGDSYSAQDPGSRSWSRIIEDTADYEIINYAIAGSSTEYGMRKLKKLIDQNELREDDTIIFQFSSVGRIHFLHQMLYPKTASQYQYGMEHHHPDEDHTWYDIGKEHIKWYLANRDKKLLILQHTGYLNILRTFAENNPSNTVIVLQLDRYYIDETFGTINYPANMFKTEVDLYDISINEAFGADYFKFTEHTLSDVRTNHLTLLNRNILAKAILDIIDKRTLEHFTYDMFLTNVIQPIKSKQHYLDYIDQGLLEFRDLGDHWFDK